MPGFHAASPVPGIDFGHRRQVPGASVGPPPGGDLAGLRRLTGASDSVGADRRRVLAHRRPQFLHRLAEPAELRYVLLSPPGTLERLLRFREPCTVLGGLALGEVRERVVRGV